MGLRYYVVGRNIAANILERNRIRSHFKAGQTLAEYALILAFISVVAIGTLMAMGGQTSSIYSTINRQLNDAQNGGATAPAHSH
jgi:Flp pilus assembly pilin Flp